MPATTEFDSPHDDGLVDLHTALELGCGVCMRVRVRKGGAGKQADGRRRMDRRRVGERRMRRERDPEAKVRLGRNNTNEHLGEKKRWASSD